MEAEAPRPTAAPEETSAESQNPTPPTSSTPDGSAVPDTLPRGTSETVDALVNDFVRVITILSDSSTLTGSELSTQFGYAVDLLDSMVLSLEGGLEGVATPITSNLEAATTTFADSFQAVVNCYEEEELLETDLELCDRLQEWADRDASSFGEALAPLVSFGTRSDEEVVALLDEGLSGDEATTLTSSASRNESREAPNASEALFEIDCDGQIFASYQAAWDQDLDWCFGVYMSGEPTEEQLRVAEAKRDNDLNGLTQEEVVKTLGSVYGLCAESGPDSYEFFEVDEVPREEQLSDFQAKMLLCPEHPDSDEINRRIEAVAKSLVGPRKIFGTGLHRIGTEIAAGTYVSRGNSEACYWERIDRNGNVIANNFTYGSRVQVTIQSTDFEFNSEFCERWEMQ